MLSDLLYRLRSLFSRRRMEADLDEEVRFHFEQQVAKNMRQGMRHQEAVRQARLVFGGIDEVKEECRDARGVSFVESIWQDMRYAGRGLRRDTAFTLTAAAALVLAIGLNSSVFTVFNGLAMTPMSARDPERLISAYSMGRLPGQHFADGFPLAEIRYFQNHAQSLSGVTALRDSAAYLGNEQSGQLLRSVAVTSNYFSVLGMNLELGRGFLEDEDVEGDPRAVAVLSFGIWQTSFGGDPEIVGKAIRISDVPVTIVGVTARHFTGRTVGRRVKVDVWFPLAAQDLIRPGESSNAAHRLDFVGRLASGASQEQARAELQMLSEQFRSESGGRPDDIVVAGTAWMDNPETRQGFLMILAPMFLGVMLVLLLACANVGNLLLARAAARQPEIAVRLSLGAGRRRIVRQLLTESLVLACSAGTIGFAVASWLPGFVMEIMAGPSASSLILPPDGRVIAYTLSISIAACLLFGLAPALHATRTSVSDALKRPGVLLRSPFSLRSFLLSGQVAVSVVLLVATGLIVRGIDHARGINPVLQEVSAMTFGFPPDTYDAERGLEFTAQLLNGLQDLERLGSVGLTSKAPLGNGLEFKNFTLPDETTEQSRLIEVIEVSAGYFEVLRIPILSGRNLTVEDATQNVVLVNEAAARTYWPDQSPLGSAVVFDNQTHEIVGVAKDEFTVGSPQARPVFYRPLASRDPIALVKQGPGGTSQRVSSIAAAIDPRVSIRITPLSVNLEGALDPARTAATLADALGFLALGLAAIGMFGVFAYVIQQRIKEIAIRTALGARPQQTIRRILLTSSRSLVAGLLLGSLGSIGVTQLVLSEHYLHGLPVYDPAALAGAVLLIVLTGVAASFLPALRAAKADPMVSLRHE